MTSEQINLRNIHCYGEYTLEEEDDIQSYFEDLSQVELPKPFINRVSNFSPEDPYETELGFGRIGEGDPIQSDTNHFTIYSSRRDDSEDLITFHMDFWHQYSEQFSTILSNVIEVLGEVDLPSTALNISLDIPLTDLLYDIEVDLPNDLDGRMEKTGIRFDYYESDGPEHIDALFQQMSHDQPNKTNVRLGRNLKGVNSERAETFFQGEIEYLVDFVEKVIP